MIRLFTLPIALLACSAIASAQTDPGVISGAVRDAQSSVIAGVAVTITNQDTDVEFRAATNEAGLYVSPPLKPGRYRVAAERTGFQRMLTNIVLELNQRAVVDLQLRVGEITEPVTVTAEAPLLGRETSGIGVLSNAKSHAGDAAQSSHRHPGV